MHTLKLGSTEVLENFLPVGWIIVASQVGLQFAAENLEGCTLSSTVRTNFSRISTKTVRHMNVEYIPRPRTCPGRGMGRRWSLKLLAE